MERRIRPWINKKIIEYIGEEEATLVDFVCSKVRIFCFLCDLGGLLPVEAATVTPVLLFVMACLGLSWGYCMRGSASPESFVTQLISRKSEAEYLPCLHYI